MTQKKVDNTENPPISENLAQALPRLTPEQVAQISPKLKRESFAPGEFIIEQGQEATCFFIIVEGYADVWHENLEGRIVKINSLGPGEYCGETGLIQGMPRNASVQASSDGSLVALVLDQDDFKTMMKRSKATEMHVAQEMVQRLIQLANAQDSE